MKFEHKNLFGTNRPDHEYIGCRIVINFKTRCSVAELITLLQSGVGSSGWFNVRRSSVSSVKADLRR